MEVTTSLTIPRGEPMVFTGIKIVVGFPIVSAIPLPKDGFSTVGYKELSVDNSGKNLSALRPTERRAKAKRPRAGNSHPDEHSSLIIFEVVPMSIVGRFLLTSG